MAAAWWFRHQALALARRMARDPRWQTVLAASPDAEGLASRVWPANVPRIAQGTGDLGARMGRVLAADRTRAVLIVGADIPGITPARVQQAFALLGRHDLVLGPAEDGGYWAIGRRAGLALPRDILGEVRWSGPHALTDTERRLRRYRVGRADTLADVDTAADFSALRSGSG